MVRYPNKLLPLDLASMEPCNRYVEVILSPTESDIERAVAKEESIRLKESSEYLSQGKSSVHEQVDLEDTLAAASSIEDVITEGSIKVAVTEKAVSRVQTPERKKPKDAEKQKKPAGRDIVSAKKSSKPADVRRRSTERAKSDAVKRDAGKRDAAESPYKSQQRSSVVQSPDKRESRQRMDSSAKHSLRLASGHWGSLRKSVGSRRPSSRMSESPKLPTVVDIAEQILENMFQRRLEKQELLGENPFLDESRRSTRSSIRDRLSLSQVDEVEVGLKSESEVSSKSSAKHKKAAILRSAATAPVEKVGSLELGAAEVKSQSSKAESKVAETVSPISEQEPEADTVALQAESETVEVTIAVEEDKITKIVHAKTRKESITSVKKKTEERMPIKATVSEPQKSPVSEPQKPPVSAARRSESEKLPSKADVPKPQKPPVLAAKKSESEKVPSAADVPKPQKPPVSAAGKSESEKVPSGADVLKPQKPPVTASRKSESEKVPSGADVPKPQKPPVTASRKSESEKTPSGADVRKPQKPPVTAAITSESMVVEDSKKGGMPGKAITSDKTKSLDSGRPRKSGKDGVKDIKDDTKIEMAATLDEALGIIEKEEHKPKTAKDLEEETKGLIHVSDSNRRILTIIPPIKGGQDEIQSLRTEESQSPEIPDVDRKVSAYAHSLSSSTGSYTTATTDTDKAIKSDRTFTTDYGEPEEILFFEESEEQPKLRTHIFIKQSDMSLNLPAIASPVPPGTKAKTRTTFKKKMPETMKQLMEKRRKFSTNRVIHDIKEGDLEQAMVTTSTAMKQRKDFKIHKDPILQHLPDSSTLCLKAACEDPKQVINHYLQAKGINQLFQYLMTKLITEKPEKPLDFLIDIVRVVEQRRQFFHSMYTEYTDDTY